MHVRNLEPGEVFFGPRDLALLNEDFWELRNESVRWRVVSAEEIDYGDDPNEVDWGYYVVTAAEVGKPWRRTTACLIGDISLCEDNDYVRPRTRAKWAARDFIAKRFPEVYYATFPDRRPGAVALRTAIFMAGPGGQLVKALQTGSYNLGAPAGELKIEDLSCVMQKVTFSDEHIQFQRTA